MTDRPRRSAKTPLEVNCPICGKRVPWHGNPVRPFCSERCRVIDRGAWASGDYAIPTDDAPPEEQEGGGEEA